MEIQNLHSWKVTPKEAVAIQNQLRDQVKIRRSRIKPKIIAGTDLSFSKNTSKASAGIVLLDFSTLEVLGEFIQEGNVSFPYLPGLLSFREGPIYLNLFKKIFPEPDLIFLDGQGIAHPRGLGLGSHMGLFLNKPTIGCAKSKLVGNFDELGKTKGSWTSLKDDKGNTIGAVLRSREGCKPIFISVGHLTNLSQSIEWTLHCTTCYQIPEPTRRAHNLVTHYRRTSKSGRLIIFLYRILKK